MARTQRRYYQVGEDWYEADQYGDLQGGTNWSVRKNGEPELAKIINVRPRHFYNPSSCYTFSTLREAVEAAVADAQS